MEASEEMYLPQSLIFSAAVHNLCDKDSENTNSNLNSYSWIRNLHLLNFISYHPLNTSVQSNHLTKLFWRNTSTLISRASVIAAIFSLLKGKTCLPFRSLANTEKF